MQFGVCVCSTWTQYKLPKCDEVQCVFWCRCIQSEITTRVTSFKHLFFMVNDSKWKADSSAAVMSASCFMPVTLVELLISCRSILGNPLTHKHRHSLWMQLQRRRLCYTAHKSRLCENQQMSQGITWKKCTPHIWERHINKTLNSGDRGCGACWPEIHSLWHRCGHQYKCSEIRHLYVFCYTHIMSRYIISEEHFVMIILTCALFSCMIFVNCIWETKFSLFFPYNLLPLFWCSRHLL